MLRAPTTDTTTEAPGLIEGVADNIGTAGFKFAQGRWKERKCLCLLMRLPRYCDLVAGYPQVGE